LWGPDANAIQPCTNLHYLGKRNTIKTSEGIRIVALGGQVDQTIVAGTSKEQHLPFHTADDARALKGAHAADILLTTAWPFGIRTGSNAKIPDGVTEPAGYNHISDLCAALRPRYHFSALPDFFYEREPFLHPPAADSPDSKQVTRFISLAPLGNPAKQKFWYAFNLATGPDTSVTVPTGTTPSPFTARSSPNGKRKALEPTPYSRFANGDDHRYNQRNKRGRRGPEGPEECYFCLSNPTTKTHLVTSIGEDVYITTAPGPLTTSSTYSSASLNFPCHMLIIPLAHAPTLSLIPGDDERRKTYSEMLQYKKALQSMVAERSDNRLGCVTYEISRANIRHVHWQFLPLPSLINKIPLEKVVEAAFRVEAQDRKYPDFEARDPGLGEGEGDFFRVWIWTPPSEEEGMRDGKSKCLTMSLPEGRFDIQFGRTVLAKLLGLEDRIRWQDCVESVDKEKLDVEAFKEAFKGFDIAA
jgi:hypothetical protein